MIAVLARRHAKLPPEIEAYPWSEIQRWWDYDQLAFGGAEA